MPFHLVAYDRDDRLIGFFIQRSQTVLQFESELLLDRSACRCRVCATDRETDGVFG